ncbi:FAD-binding domain-containing protein [Rhizodiscina lignyota]|uniref:FAD-binding domain-containing protein n=1 Tax=Rhizodiscina lignyota TaxID=1504668 RepID=A0A9P4I5E4_9PEZI|nr:FAD-binding domain-containing protein [Rhizodiscina lignyota]
MASTISILSFFAINALTFLSARAAAPTFNCQPNQSCWPTTADWNAFNKTVSGQLKATVMLASPCYPSSPNFNEAECATVEANYFDPTFRQTVYGSMEHFNWEACGSANCAPNLTVTTQSKDAVCSLGTLSAFHVDASTAADITATLAFVRKHNIRLSIRNTGHDYLGRSAIPNSLALEMSNFQTMEFHPTFQLNNCKSTSAITNVGIMGAGVIGDEALPFFSAKGMQPVVGACPTVGPAGGFSMGGGHGPLSPTNGLLADNAVEFDIVTADGKFRTVNQCNDPDLFWALRGGGAGTYAIMVNYKTLVYPKTTFATWHFRANISSNAITPNTTMSTVLRDVITAVSTNQTTWTKNNMTGFDVFTPTTVELMEMLPSNDNALAQLKSLTSSVHQLVTTHPDLAIVNDDFILYDDQDAWETGQAEFITRTSGDGIGIITPSRLIPRDILASTESINTFTAGFDAAAALSELAFFKTAPPSSKNTGDTSVNPAWYSTAMHFIAGPGWPPGTPQALTDALQEGARNGLAKVANVLDVQAAYTNEADWAEPNWQSVFYGSNYNKLLQIKQKYDPDNLFTCWKCVGSDVNAPQFSCYAETQ